MCFPGADQRAEHMTDVNVGRRIREARESLELSQHELAERVGVSQRAVSYVEKQNWVKQSTLERYAAAMGRSLSYFLRPYDDDPASALTTHEAIEQAFAVVFRDPEFGFGARPPNSSRWRPRRTSCGSMSAIRESASFLPTPSSRPR